MLSDTPTTPQDLILPMLFAEDVPFPENGLFGMEEIKMPLDKLP